jgi:cAMP-dependent protein kinase regulator
VIGSGVPEALHRLTRHMTPDEAAALRAACATLVVGDDEVVVRDGHPNDALYVVLEGRFSVAARVDGQEVSFGEKREGDLFGELSLLTSAPAVADVRGSGVLLRLDRDALDALGRSCPTAELALVRALTEDLARRVREADTSLRAGGRKRALIRGVFTKLLGGGR